MPAYAFHSVNFRERLPEYAQRLGVDEDRLRAAYEAMLADRALVERPAGADKTKLFVHYVDLEPVLEDPVQRALYAALKTELPCRIFPHGKGWGLFKERMLRVWEHLYNMIINKIPIHWVRLAWLRAGGMKIGKNTSIWRNTEIVGMENIVIGDDSVVGWHSQLDGRAGLFIGDHVSIGSYVIIIAGGHDPTTEDFSSFGEPVYIDDYAWVATRAMITNGAHLEEGAVVGLGSIVSGKTIPAYKIAAGFSAKVVGERPRNLNYQIKGNSWFNFLH